jgi:hypothetical protein
MTDDAVADIDLNLDHTEAAAIFNEEDSHDIWNQPDEEQEDESDVPAFLRRRKKNKKD